MPYDSIKELPENVRSALSEKEQEKWLKVFNSVFEKEKDEQKAIRAAWAMVKKAFIYKDAKKRYTLGVVYEPDVLDAHDEFMDAEEIEKACWNFMRKLHGGTSLTKVAVKILGAIVKASDEGGQLTLDITDVYDEVKKAGLNDMHISTPMDHELGEIVENYIAPVDMEINGEKVKKGTWLMGIVWNQEYFQKILSGERTGLSMEGVGRRVEIDAS